MKGLMRCLIVAAVATVGASGRGAARSYEADTLRGTRALRVARRAAE